jgi:hypothetical protein
MTDADTRRRTGYALTTPCRNCPFRTDISPYLRADRAREIAASLRDGGTFDCHKTITFDDVDDDGEDQPRRTGREQQCAGALIVMQREGFAGQMTRISGRLGLYDPDRLDVDAPVFGSLGEWIRAQDGGDVPTAEIDGEVLEFEHCGIVGPDCEDPAGYGGSDGVWENDDPPTCHPVDDTCSYCGAPVCTACRADRADQVLCVDCAETEETT